MNEEMNRENFHEDIFSVEISDDMNFSKGNQINGVEIFKTGTYRGKTYTIKDLDEMVSNFNTLKGEDVGFEPPVRVGHRSKNDVQNVLSLAGYIKTLYRKGNSLFADVEITEPDAYEKIKRGTLRKRSAEIGPYEDNKGNLFKKVIWGFGFVDIPQVEGMAEVKVYSKREGEEMDYIENETFAVISGQARNDLADSAFAYIEPGGTKDATGKTKPRSLRHFPIHDAAHVRNALSRIGQGAKFGSEALPRVKEAAKKFGIDASNNEGDTSNTNNNKEGETMEEFARLGSPCKMPDGSEGTMQIKGHQMVCVTKKGTNMSKEGDNVELSKEEYSELLTKAEKTEKLQKEMDEINLSKRIEKVKDFAKEGKSIADTKEEEDFVKSLDEKQYIAYSKIKESQPKLVELDKDAGKGEDGSSEAADQKEKDEAVDLAEKLTKPYQKKEE